MIDALFGSRTRVKLLHLFLNNPGTAFYVREITRLIDEQINSVRRELANMLSVGVIVSDSSDNKLYYSVNQKYDYYLPLRSIFADDMIKKPKSLSSQTNATWTKDVEGLPGVRFAVAAGILVRGSAGKVDLLIVGSIPKSKLANCIKKIEKSEGRELNYTVLSYDDFYYRLSVRDRFITEILSGAHRILVDTDRLLEREKDV